MKKELFIHFSFLTSLFLIISIFKGWLSFSYWPFWVGGFLGTLLPDVDHFVYVYFLRPHELTSQRVSSMVDKRNLKGTLHLLAETRDEREELIFHTILFQLIFLVLTFFVITSTGNMFGRGLVLAFSLHLLIDQVVDFSEMGSISSWFNNFPIQIREDRQRVYWWVLLALVLIMAFLM